jgi:hypothetical protein
MEITPERKRINEPAPENDNKQGTQMKHRALRGLVAALVGLSLQWSVQAAGKFYFPIGLSYISGLHDANDKLADFYTRDGWDVDKIDIPIGLTFNPYYELDNGLGAGVSVGPASFMVVEERIRGSYHRDETFVSYAVPVGAFVRYTLLRDKMFSPYIRAGVKYPFAGGDNLESSQVGPFGAIGVEIWRNKKVGMSLEVGYDGSEVKVKYTGSIRTPGVEYSDKVMFPGWTVSLAVLF